MSIYRTRNGTNLNTIKNSLSDILPNKSQNAIERTKFEQSQQASLVKAINTLECPVKEKHIRNIILGTCYEKSAVPFWYNTVKLQLYGSPILCWKFCYVLHKLLRDGYSSTAEDSFQFVPTLEDLSKSWIHLRQGYGTMLYHYLNYLSFKIKFHKKNQFIPGNLMIEDKDLIEVTGNNIDNYFQLCCEFFDYIEEILGLQSTVFMTMDRSRSNSMTESGQCKLAPLVLCIQESNQLYDFCVKFLFKLHDNLPSDILEGHRERFQAVFSQLTKFYECSKNLQYFKNLISIPELPAIAPNFRQKSDFSSYSKPVVTVVEEPIPSVADSIHDDSDSLLVDVSENQQQSQFDASSSSLSTTNELQQAQLQQYVYTQNLLQEIDLLRAQLERVTNENSFELNVLRDMNRNLAQELAECQTELKQQIIANTSLEEKLRITAENERRHADLNNLEKKAVSSEEKFNKMKELYMKLKDQHVTLLRQEADARKQKLSLDEACEHSNKSRKEMETRLEQAIAEKIKCEEQMQEKTNELQTMKSEIEKNQAENINSNQTYQEQIKSLKEKLAENEFNLSEANEKVYDLEDKKKKLKELSEKCEKLNQAKELADTTSKWRHVKLCQDIYTSNVESCVTVIRDSLHLFDDPVLMNCKSGAEYLLYKLQPLNTNIKELMDSYRELIIPENLASDDQSAGYIKLLKFLGSFTLLTSDCIIFGKITALTAADIDQGNDLANFCQKFGKTSLVILEKMFSKFEVSDEQIEELNSLLAEINAKLVDLLPKVHDINNAELGDLIEQEMHKTSEAIESAVAKLELLINKSRENETGVKLEVNDKILDSCTSLMKAIKELIIKSQDLQKEIVAQGRGTSSVKEYYSKNHKWTEGLVSAAKLVGLGANLLIEKADKLVNGDGSLEEIIVCSNEIAASTAQLVVSSNVKANRDSENRLRLIAAKNDVSSATANLVASAKSCSQIIDDKSSMDFSNISLHQTKLLEMEAQVAVIHLESQLEKEKKKLYQLRRKHYKNDMETQEK